MKKRIHQSVNSQPADLAIDKKNRADSLLPEKTKSPVQTEFTFDENNILNRRPTRLSLSIRERAKESGTGTVDESMSKKSSLGSKKTGK